ncbi:MAG: hypothetical protein HC802_01775 [Caldilineaceae bacterium]|nr:hypothetical protein [Caldilineaceae bacterium]
MEEGFEVTLAEPEFAARTNQPVEFQVFTSSTRLGDRLGQVVELSPGEVSVLPPIRTVLRYGKKGEAQQLPVQLAVRLTEIGTLEVWCQSQQSSHRWQLQFDVRHTPENATQIAVADTVDQTVVELAQEAIRRVFNGDGEDGESPERIRRILEELFELPKEAWPTALIRQLADALIEVGETRGRSPEHEIRWLNLLGYCLRPGYGDPLDEWRIKQIWKLHFQGPAFARAPQNRTEWWIFWRRVAGGLKAGQQLEVFHQVRSALQQTKKRKRKAGAKFSGHVSAGEETEIWMMLANLEWLPAGEKVGLGELLLARLTESKPKPQELWALSRFGARNTIYGPLDRLVPSATAVEWLRALLDLAWEPSDSLAHALIVMARYTGDRMRDIPQDLRDEIVAWMAKRATPSAIRACYWIPTVLKARKNETGCSVNPCQQASLWLLND